MPAFTDACGQPRRPSLRDGSRGGTGRAIGRIAGEFVTNLIVFCDTDITDIIVTAESNTIANAIAANTTVDITIRLLQQLLSLSLLLL